MEAPQSGEVTSLLLAWQAGDEGALQGLMDLVYQDLRRAAHRYMLRERSSHTLQTTDLIHEVYLRLVGARRISWQNRAHFLAICARLMRRVLVDFARARLPETGRRNPASGAGRGVHGIVPARP